jgi:hypothetical protein
MKEFEPLIGRWHGEGEVPMEPPMKISVEATIERLGEFIVLSVRCSTDGAHTWRLACSG